MFSLLDRPVGQSVFVDFDLLMVMMGLAWLGQDMVENGLAVMISLRKSSSWFAMTICSGCGLASADQKNDESKGPSKDYDDPWQILPHRHGELTAAETGGMPRISSGKKR